MTPSPIAAVLTRSGDLPRERRFFTDDGFEAVIYLSSAAPDAVRRALESRGRSVVVVPEEREAIAVLDHMKCELGATRVLVEGGATLNGELISQGLVDEFFLTLAPRVAGGDSAHPAVQWPGEPTSAAIKQLSLIHARPAQTGELFLRYRLEPIRD